MRLVIRAAPRVGVAALRATPNHVIILAVMVWFMQTSVMRMRIATGSTLNVINVVRRNEIRNTR